MGARHLLLIFLFCQSLVYVQAQTGKYISRIDEFDESLNLKPDSTFEYKFSFSLGETISSGKWKMKHDTVFLSDYYKPWTIAASSEEYIDSLEDEVCIRVISRSNVISMRGHGVYFYIDGIRVLGPNYEVVEGFEVWVNDDFEQVFQTDSLGMVRIPKREMHQINIDYDTYAVRGKNNNYFELILNNFPIYTSPPALKNNQWIFELGKLIAVRNRSNVLSLEK